MDENFTIRHSAALISAIELMVTTKVIKSGLGKTMQAIAAFWNPAGNIFPSQSTLASMTGIHRRTINTHIKTLTGIAVVETTTRPGRYYNGEKVASTLMYTFNESKLGELFNKAKAKLKVQAIATARKARKDHFKALQNDHTNRAKAQADRITVSQALADWFKSLCKKAFSSEVQHKEKLAQQQAYKSGIERNRIARGELFSRAERKRRAEEAKRIQPERENAQQLHERIVTLSKSVLTNKYSPGSFTDAMYYELLSISKQGQLLDIATRMALSAYKTA